MQTLIVLASILSLIAAYVPKSEHKLDAEAESEIGKGVNLVVGHSTIPGAGRGVFAARDMKSCERVEKAEAIPLTEAEYPVGALRQYLFSSQSDDNKTVLVLNHGSLFNHGGDNAQIGYRPAQFNADGPQAFEFYALRDIKAGEELFIHYGYEPEPVHHAEMDEDEEGVRSEQVAKTLPGGKVWTPTKTLPAKTKVPVLKKFPIQKKAPSKKAPPSKTMPGEIPLPDPMTPEPMTKAMPTKFPKKMPAKTKLPPTKTKMPLKMLPDGTPWVPSSTEGDDEWSFWSAPQCDVLL